MNSVLLFFRSAILFWKDKHDAEAVRIIPVSGKSSLSAARKEEYTIRISISDIAGAETVRACLSRYPIGLETIRFGIGDVLDQGADALERFRREWEALSCGRSRLYLHGPFLDLFPASVDRAVRRTALSRFRAAYDAARNLGAEGIVFHSGYFPAPYGIGPWLEGASAFWEAFLREREGALPIYVENVFEPEPGPLAELAARCPELSLCLDVGHAGAVSPVPPEEWIRQWGSRIGHVHLHNNDGRQDLHSGLRSGILPMERILPLLSEVSPQSDLVLEIPDGNALHSSLSWLEGFKAL